MGHPKKLGATRVKKAPGSRGRTIIVVAALALFANLGVTFGLWVEGNRVSTSVSGYLADAAVVYYTDDPLDMVARMNSAIGLLRAGTVRSVFIVGGFRKTGVETGAEKALHALLAAGLNPDAASADNCSFDTRSNLDSISRKAARENWVRIVHVSDGMHLLRIKNALANAKRTHAQQDFFAGVPYRGIFHVTARANYEIATWVLIALSPELATELAKWMRVSDIAQCE